MDKEQEFNIEIEKLSAINKLNVEIFNRINTLKKGNDYEYIIIDKISLKNNVISFNFKSKNIKSQSLNQYFQNEDNLFNDKLPSSEYFDLNNIILKYSMLNPKKALDVIIKWKKTLENVQIYLGKIETQITDEQKLTNKILQLFDVNFDPNNNFHVVDKAIQPKETNNFLSKFEIEVICNEISYDSIFQIAKLINENFILLQSASFDLVEKHPQINLSNNNKRAQNNTTTYNIVLLNEKIVQDKRYSYVVENCNSWFGIGACLKSVTKERGYNWNYGGTEHVSYFFTERGEQWENGKNRCYPQQPHLTFATGDVIEFYYENISKKFKIKNITKNLIGEMTIKNGENLSDVYPAIMLYNLNNSIRIL